MKQNKATTFSAEFNPELRAILGGRQNEALHTLVNTAWDFAYICLWNGLNLSRMEAEFAKQKIEEFICNGKNTEKECRKFCERVLLAKNYVLKNPGKYIPVPSFWFKEDNTNEGTGIYL